jgi:hypothetical protein
MENTTERRGFALPAAIGALVIVGVLVTAGFYMARQELLSGVASRFSAMAMNVAETGTDNVLINRTSALTSLPVGGRTTLVDTADAGIVSVEVTRMADRLFFLNTTATVTEGGTLWSGATRRLGLVTRMTTADMHPPAALTTQDSLVVGGKSTINGNDTIPNGWSSLCGPTANKPGVLINDTSAIKTKGAPFTVAGDPKILEDTTINTEKLLSFGDVTWDELVAVAEKTYPVGVSSRSSVEPDSTLGGSGSYYCNTALLDNWGDPYHPLGACGNYFPIIYAKGDLMVTGNYGQGIMLVEGDLILDGGFTFFGPVYVKGELMTQGTGGHINGGIVAANVNLTTSSVLGNATLNYSSCAVERAILNNSALTKIRPLAMRSWVDLSNVIGS